MNYFFLVMLTSVQHVRYGNMYYSCFKIKIQMHREVNDGSQVIYCLSKDYKRLFCFCKWSDNRCRACFLCMNVENIETNYALC